MLKRTIRLPILGLVIMSCQTQEVEIVSEKYESSRIMEVACGECMFDLPGDGCHLAVRIDGKAYFVSGTHIDDHGDAHSNDGFCNSIRTAQVKGELRDDIYHVHELTLIPSKD